MALYDSFGEAEFNLPIELTEEEIQERQSKYFQNLAKVKVEVQKLDDLKTKVKSVTKPIEDENKQLFREITEGVVHKTVLAMEIPDEDEGTIGYFNLDGVELHRRPMTIQEKQQYRIKFGRKSKREVAQ